MWLVATWLFLSLNILLLFVNKKMFSNLHFKEVVCKISFVAHNKTLSKKKEKRM